MNETTLQTVKVGKGRKAKEKRAHTPWGEEVTQVGRRDTCADCGVDAVCEEAFCELLCDACVTQRESEQAEYLSELDGVEPIELPVGETRRRLAAGYIEAGHIRSAGERIDWRHLSEVLDRNGFESDVWEVAAALGGPAESYATIDILYFLGF